MNQAHLLARRRAMHQAVDQDHQDDSLLAAPLAAGTNHLLSSNADLVNVAALDRVFRDSTSLLFRNRDTMRNHA